MAMEGSRGEEGTPRKNLENHVKRAIRTWCVGVFFSLKRAEAKRDDAAREKQEGMQGQWQQESPFREVLEQARRNEDMGCSSEVVRKNQRRLLRGKSSELAPGTIREAYEKVVKEEAGRLGIVREILRKTRISRGESLRQSEDREELPCRTSARIATVFLWRTICGGYRRRRSTAVGGVQSVEKEMNGEHPTGFWCCSSAQAKMRQQFSVRTRSRKDFVNT